MTPIWFTNFSIIYEKKYIFEVVPHKSFDLNRKLNSLLRLSIYYACIVYLLDKSRINIFYIPFIVAVLSYVIHKKFKGTHVDNVQNQLMNNEGYENNTNVMKYYNNRNDRGLCNDTNTEIIK